MTHQVYLKISQYDFKGFKFYKFYTYQELFVSRTFNIFLKHHGNPALFGLHLYTTFNLNLYMFTEFKMRNLIRFFFLSTYFKGKSVIYE